MIYIKGSKTDQYNVGCTRNQFESNEELCPVQAMRDFERHFPERLRGTERERPIFRYQGGGWIRREHIQHYLELAAVALNIDPLRMGSHSLRIGGGHQHVPQRQGSLEGPTFWPMDVELLSRLPVGEPRRGA